jgi:hypothetical protein
LFLDLGAARQRTVHDLLESDVFVYTAVNESINGGAHDTMLGAPLR